MFAVLLFLIAVGGMVGVGYWRGGSRIGLALAPLLICSVLLWIAGGIVYQIDFMRNFGLVWPALFLIIPGLVGGYALKFWLKKKLSEKPSDRDRIIGGVIGFFMGIVITWLGLVYQTVWSASRSGEVSALNQGMARTLNNGVVRWIPGIGAGSSAVMDLMDIATAEKDVQQRAIQDLELDKLTEIPAMQAILNDEDILDQIESIQRGNLLALWSLQKNKQILALFEDPQMREAMEGISLEDLAEAVEKASQPKSDEDG